MLQIMENYLYEKEYNTSAVRFTWQSDMVIKNFSIGCLSGDVVSCQLFSASSDDTTVIEKHYLLAHLSLSLHKVCWHGIHQAVGEIPVQYAHGTSYLVQFLNDEVKYGMQS